MVIWVCEASEVNNLTASAVGPNSRDVTEVIPLLLRRLHPRNAYSGSVPFGSDNNFTPISCLKNCPKLGFRLKTLARGGQGHISIALSKYGESLPLRLSSVFVFVSACDLVFVTVITTEASVDSMCHGLSEYVQLYGSVKPRK